MELNSQIQKLVDWLTPKDTLRQADIIFVFGGNTLQLPIKAAELYHSNYAPKIILTGKTGTSTNPDWTKPIAKVFEAKLLELNVPQEDVLLQSTSTNTLEDVLLSKALIKSYMRKSSRIIIVSRPMHQLRSLATIRKHIPDYYYINQPCDFDAEIDTPEYILERCLAEFDRLKIYAEQGDIIKIEVPDEIEEIVTSLKRQQHLFC